MLGIGDQAPEFEVLSDEGKAVRLSSLRGAPVILYFYPKDDTPGCTRESCGFRDALSKIAAFSGAKVVGVSVDDVESHRQFKEKYGLNFMLLADTQKTLSTLFGVLAGDVSSRSTFILNKNGKIVKMFPRVKVDGHIEEVLEALEELSS